MDVRRSGSVAVFRFWADWEPNHSEGALSLVGPDGETGMVHFSRKGWKMFVVGTPTGALAELIAGKESGFHLKKGHRRLLRYLKDHPEALKPFNSKEAELANERN